jgi:AcrR family transcriptional regulator
MREDPRVTRSKACVLAATLRVLQSEGMSAVNIERVSAESGVAKTTIYRHWEGRAELVFDALESLMEQAPWPHTALLRDDLLVGLTGLSDGLRDSLWASVLPSMMAAAAHDEHVAELAREFAARRRSGLEQRLQRAIDDGEIAADTNVGLLTSEIVGPLFYRRYMSQQPWTDELLAEHIDRLVVSVRPCASSGSGERLQ